MGQVTESLEQFQTDCLKSSIRRAFMDRQIGQTQALPGYALLRILTDRGSEYCGNREQHEYALYLDLEGIDHTRTKTKSPQTNGICERFHQTIQNEFYATAFRRKLYRSLEDLQADVDVWVKDYNEQGFPPVDQLTRSLDTSSTTCVA
jgi:transposase InsO family protein